MISLKQVTSRGVALARFGRVRLSESDSIGPSNILFARSRFLEHSAFLICYRLLDNFIICQINPLKLDCFFFSSEHLWSALSESQLLLLFCSGLDLSIGDSYSRSKFTVQRYQSFRGARLLWPIPTRHHGDVGRLRSQRGPQSLHARDSNHRDSTCEYVKIDGNAAIHRARACTQIHMQDSRQCKDSKGKHILGVMI